MLCMHNNKFTKQVYLWDRALNDRNIIKTWSSEIKSIFEQCNILGTYTNNSPFLLKPIVKTIVSTFEQNQRQTLKEECGLMPTLRTFNLFKDFMIQPAYITKPLTFYQRRILARTRLGCLPLRMETGRYSVPRLPEAERTCLVCKVDDQLVDVEVADHGGDPVDHDGEAVEAVTRSGNPVESETHFLFQCVAYEAERGIWYGKMTLPNDFDNLPLETKLSIVPNDQTNVKFTAQYILNAFNLRSKIINKIM